MAVVLIRAAVDLLGEVVDQALDQGRQAEDVVEVGGMSQIRTSTVPKLWCGRTSHQISRIVLMKPVWTMWLSSQVYSDQFRIKRGQAGGGQGLHHLDALRVQARVAPLPERAVDRERQQVGRCCMIRSQIMIALSPESTPDVDVQAEGDQPPGGLLEQVDQAVVALVGGDFLVLPARERDGSPPQKSRRSWRAAASRTASDLRRRDRGGLRPRRRRPRC